MPTEYGTHAGMNSLFQDERNVLRLWWLP